MHIDRKISRHREPGLIESRFSGLVEPRVPGLAEPGGRFRPNRPGGSGSFGGWGPKLG